MDRQHRHDLKHDKFVDEIGALSVRARDNQRVLYTIGVAVVVVALAAFGIYFYLDQREEGAQKVLAEAIEVVESPLIPESGQAPADAKYKTAAERTAAAEKLFQKVQNDFSGTDASDVAGLYLARIYATRGDVAKAQPLLEEFIDDHPKHVLVSPARYSLYQIRIENGQGEQVVNELTAEMAKAEPVLPNDALLALLAYAYEAQGNDAKLRETYRRILTEFPDSPYALEAQRRVGPA